MLSPGKAGEISERLRWVVVIFAVLNLKKSDFFASKTRIFWIIILNINSQFTDQSKIREEFEIKKG